MGLDNLFNIYSCKDHQMVHSVAAYPTDSL